MTRKSKREIEAQIEEHGDGPRPPTLAEMLTPDVLEPVDESAGLVRNPQLGELIKWSDYFDDSGGGDA